MKLLINLLSISLSFAIFLSNEALANGISGEKIERISVKLKTVDFFEAAVELDFYSNEQDPLFLEATIQNVTTRPVSMKISKGRNKKTVYFPRNPQYTQNITTSIIVIRTTMMSGIPHYNHSHDLVIHWPGLDDFYPDINFAKTPKSNFADVAKILINRNLEKSEQVIKSLLAEGFPVEKITLFRARNSNSSRVSINNHVSVTTMKNVLRVVANSIPVKTYVKITNSNQRHEKNNIAIGSADWFSDEELLSAAQQQKLKLATLSDAEFLNILKYTPPTLTNRSDELYEEAYQLIDTSLGRNLERARNILEELIRINPNYPRAYLELARYHMKTNWPKGLLKAESLILTAVDIDPKLADSHVLLGYVYTNLGRFEQAEQEYLLAEKLGTDNLWLYANWGLNFEHQGMGKEANEHYLKVVNSASIVKKNLLPKRWVYAYSRMFEYLIQQQQYQVADNLYSKSANEFKTQGCDLQKQAELRLYYRHDITGSIDSYFNAKQQGCRQEHPILSVAYYSQWAAIDAEKSSQEKKSALRQAESTAPDEATLFSALAKSDTTAELIPMLIKKDTTSIMKAMTDQLHY